MFKPKKSISLHQREPLVVYGKLSKKWARKTTKKRVMNSFGSSEGSMPYNSGKNRGDIDLSLKCRNTRKGDSKALSFKLQKAKKELKFGKLQKQSSKKRDGKRNP